ncbi:hypothetical protein ABBQ38_004588 [Trebouxia sp. C0009 RCD-2024]
MKMLPIGRVFICDRTHNLLTWAQQSVCTCRHVAIGAIHSTWKQLGCGWLGNQPIPSCCCFGIYLVLSTEVDRNKAIEQNRLVAKLPTPELLPIPPHPSGLQYKCQNGYNVPLLCM